ncbi:MAG: hypothetical protein JRH20_11375 [Deltaproteobacteria bacterium]|nr:hypothetical protein [Deltaproteobacteria bacterium]
MDVAHRLKLWLQDWRGMARAIFTRRADLIRLGLARRRSPRVVEEAEVAMEDDGTLATFVE